MMVNVLAGVRIEIGRPVVNKGIYPFWDVWKCRVLFLVITLIGVTLAFRELGSRLLNIS